MLTYARGAAHRPLPAPGGDSGLAVPADRPRPPGPYYTPEYQDVKHLADFFKRGGLEYRTMPSQNGLVKTGDRVYVLAEPGRSYVAYAAAGGTFSIEVAPGSYVATRFDPRTGREIPLGRVRGGVQRFEMPDRKDWVVRLSRAGG